MTSISNKSLLETSQIFTIAFYDFARILLLSIEKENGRKTIESWYNSLIKVFLSISQILYKLLISVIKYLLSFDIQTK